jgi:hypothetical protein
MSGNDITVKCKLCGCELTRRQLIKVGDERKLITVCAKHLFERGFWERVDKAKKRVV